MTATLANEIRIVIGSWGSYNECNERALGSKWLTLCEYEDFEEIEEELKKEGFELDGIDEELFIQDIEGFPASGVNFDYVDPRALFELFKKSGVLDDYDKYKMMEIVCDIEGYHTWKDKVENDEDGWTDEIYLYPGFDWYDLGYHFIHEVNCTKIPEYLDNYIDYKSYGESFGYDGFYEYDGGIVEIRR